MRTIKFVAAREYSRRHFNETLIRAKMSVLLPKMSLRKFVVSRLHVYSLIMILDLGSNLIGYISFLRPYTVLGNFVYLIAYKADNLFLNPEITAVRLILASMFVLSVQEYFHYNSATLRREPKSNLSVLTWKGGYVVGN